VHLAVIYDLTATLLALGLPALAMQSDKNKARSIPLNVALRVPVLGGGSCLAISDDEKL
jgi:hypothetical protein